MSTEDKALRRRVEHEIARYDIDFSLGNVAVVHSVVYLSVKVKRTLTPEGRNVDLQKLMTTIVDSIRVIPGVADVAMDCDLLG